MRKIFDVVGLRGDAGPMYHTSTGAPVPNVKIGHYMLDKVTDSHRYQEGDCVVYMSAEELKIAERAIAANKKSIEDKVKQESWDH